MAHIKTYARLKPSKRAYTGYEMSKNVLTVHIPDNKDVLVVGPQQSVRSSLSYDITFTDIFRPTATQEDVFDGVAKGIIENFLNGYNGTIFAYGQTGTGKTYTVEGNTARYSTRGLSTRALSMIYQQLETRTEDHISVYLSYLEIYQEVAYDLLNPTSKSSLPVAPFAKVTVFEGPQDSCILRGLSLHLAANEEIAQMLLLQGQANRKVAETPVNQRSSRSHAVFTVYLQVRKHDSEVVLNSKLHLVDLAGSERVSKTGVDGQQLTEAKSINLSLHHLETVIIALQTDRSTSSSGGDERSKGDSPLTQSKSNTSFMSGPSSDSGSRTSRFVPYRNSLLTMVLKDSLGGNCLTAMIATISMEPENLGESISTCRFAQRVARISNNARRNEAVDDKTLIKKLRNKVAHLEHQVAVLKLKERNNSPVNSEKMLNLTDEDRALCARIMDGFLQGVIADPVNAGIYDQSRFRECLHLLKHQYLHSLSLASQLLTNQRLQMQVQQGASGKSSETLLQVQPNNPQRDSGDHIVSEASQTDSSTVVSEQRIPDINVLDAFESEKCFSSKDNQAGGLNFTVEAPGLEEDDSDREQTFETGDRHLSPCERSRAKRSRKMTERLTNQKQGSEAEHEQGGDIQEDVLVQKLLAAESSLRLKLQAAEEQVADQRAYLIWLKYIQADPLQITREQLVEQHFLQHHAKYEDKLNKLLVNKAKLMHTLAPDREATTLTRHSNEMSMEEKVAHLKQGQVSPAARQIYHVLKNQKKEQQKKSTKLDKEKIPLKFPNMDRELTTLEKLRELKHKLKMSQHQVSLTANIEPHCDMSERYQPQAVFSVQSFNSVDCHLDHRTSFGKQHHYDPGLIHSLQDSGHSELHPKTVHFSDTCYNMNRQEKHSQGNLAMDCSEKLGGHSEHEWRSVATGPQEATENPECSSKFLLNNMQPYQRGMASQQLIRPLGDTSDQSSLTAQKCSAWIAHM